MDIDGDGNFETYGVVLMTKESVKADHSVHLWLVYQQEHGKVADSVKGKTSVGICAVSDVYIETCTRVVLSVHDSVPHNGVIVL